MFVSRMAGGEPEIFASVQGEGATSGLPSVFVRLSRCNLRCGFCDTRYTWDWSRFDPEVESMTLPPDEVARLARERSGEAIRNAVVTGGEPMLQQRDLLTLAEQLRTAGFRIEVETNGTHAPGQELAAAVDQWNVSPKLAGSGNPERAREVPEALTWFAACAGAWFKFVVCTPADVDEAADLSRRYAVPAGRVILMPEGTDAATLSERSRWVAARCLELGFRLGARLHVHLWGDTRGR